MPFAAPIEQGPVREPCWRGRRGCCASATSIASRSTASRTSPATRRRRRPAQPSPRGPLPPLVAADGFESVTDETLGGARVLSGAGAPTISGARSLYLPPVDVARHRVDGHAVRAARARSRRATRSCASPTGPSTPATRPTSTTWSRAWADRSERRSCPRTSGTRRRPRPSIRQPVTLGPIQTATIGLPASTRTSRSCSRGPRRSRPPAAARRRAPCPALIIDDLRAE